MSAPTSLGCRGMGTKIGAGFSRTRTGPEACGLSSMNIRRAVSISVLGFAVFRYQGEVAYAAGEVAPAADPVQHCLDLVQLNLARKNAPTFHVTSHPVQNPPKDLPIQCVAGNLEEIKSALRNQIAKESRPRKRASCSSSAAEW